MAGESFILMGVSGSGKTLIGSKVAALLSAKFIDGDDLHPAKNIDKMIFYARVAPMFISSG